MRLVQARFVTACQQLLALGVVLAVLTPAAGVLSLDIVGAPATGRTPALSGTLASATVPTSAVASEVTEIPLTTQTGDGRSLAGTTLMRGSISATHVTSRPQDISGYGAVGVTWAHGVELTRTPSRSSSAPVRTTSGPTGARSSTTTTTVPTRTAPRPPTARPGTDPLIIGDVDQVQVKAQVTSPVNARGETTVLPADLKLAVVEPGTAKDVRDRGPGRVGHPGRVVVRRGVREPQQRRHLAARREDDPGDADDLQPRPVGRRRVDPQPKNLRYGTVSAGFVHHTVNANDYTEAQVPGIMRSIYAYHVKSRGWSDIGYNFLVDRFGRIWEGRYGGVDKNVVGAHTLGYNDYSFAMSAIGNFDVVEPPAAVIQAYGALFAWKLALNGVNPASTAQQVGKSTFQAINGHRDAGKTACPGRYLYAQIPAIRALAASAAPAVAPPPPPLEIGDPAPQSNLVGAGYPDLVVRRASDGRGMILPTGGLTSFSKATVVVGQGLGQPARGAAVSRPDRRRRARPGLDQRAGRAPDPPGQGQRQVQGDLQGRQDHQGPHLDDRGRRPRQGRPQRPRRPSQGPHGRPARDAEGRLHPRGAGQGHGQLHPVHRRRRPERRRRGRPVRPRRQGSPLRLRRHGHRHVRRPLRSARVVVGLQPHHRRRRLQR